MRSTLADSYTLPEIAAAARVPPVRVEQAVRAMGIVVRRGRVSGIDAVEVVRCLRRGTAHRHALPLTVMPAPHARRAGPLALSALAHALVLAALVALASMQWLAKDTVPPKIPAAVSARLVFVNELGPGGGGGGGGASMPAPPPKAERKAPAPKVTAPVPRAQRHASPARLVPPPRPAPRPTPPPQPKPEPPVITPPAPPLPRPIVPMPTPAPPAPPVVTPAPPAPAPPAVTAPVIATPGDANERSGLVESPGHSTSAGSGSGGGVGSGQGLGIGEGHGGGIGPGSGGGTGGGPYRPGSGIAPPQLLREVRANYTDDARRKAIEGEVVLDIVVRRDGTVGQIRVVRTLGGGLEQKAIDAVRQWRFTPASRNGVAVDVSVDVSVEFKLR